MLAVRNMPFNSSGVDRYKTTACTGVLPETYSWIARHTYVLDVALIASNHINNARGITIVVAPYAESLSSHNGSDGVNNVLEHPRPTHKRSPRTVRSSSDVTAVSYKFFHPVTRRSIENTFSVRSRQLQGKLGRVAPLFVEDRTYGLCLGRTILLV